jgi:hypothetical protein
MNYTIEQLIAEQLSVSTAEEELNYFFRPAQERAPVESGSAMPSGTYRVVDGSLYLVLADVPDLPESISVEQKDNR